MVCDLYLKAVFKNYLVGKECSSVVSYKSPGFDLDITVSGKECRAGEGGQSCHQPWEGRGVHSH